MAGSARVRRNLRRVAAAVAAINFVFVVAAVSAGILFVGAASFNRVAEIAADAVAEFAAEQPATWQGDRERLRELAGLATFAPTGDDGVRVIVRNSGGDTLAAVGPAPRLARTYTRAIERDGAVIGSIAVERSAMPFLRGMGWIALFAFVLSLAIYFAVHWLAMRVIVRRERELTEATEAADAQAAQARDSERRLRAIADGLPLAIVYADASGRLRFANHQAEIWLDRPYARLVGETLTELVPSPALAALTERALGGRPVSAEEALTFGDGETRTMLIRMIPHDDEHGALAGFFCALIDLTEQKNIERQLWQAQKMEAIGQMTGGLAHDFNNILTVVLGNLAMLDRAPDTASRERMVASAQAAGRRAVDLTQRLLSFAREQTLTAEAIDAGSQLHDMQDLLVRAAGDRCTVRFDLADDLHTVRLDRGQLKNAVLNLTINARDAMPEGGRVTIGTRNADLGSTEAGAAGLPAGRYVAITVADTGEGMTREVAERVFEPFFTTKESGRGSGLGLSMVYGFVRQSGGGIVLDLSPGSGTRVTLYFPAVASAPATVPAARDVEDLPRGDERVLIVEDNPDVLNYLVTVLAHLGYAVERAATADAAERAARSLSDLDLVVSDLVLPGNGDGPEAAARIAAVHAHVGFVFLSGQATSEEPIDVAGRRCPVLAKPVSPARLARTVRSVLDAKPTRPTLRVVS